MNIHDSRLTAGDIATMETAVADALETWTVSARQSGAVYLPKGSDAVTLERVAAHSIGCSTYDLRDAEIDIIAGIIDDMTQALV